MSAEDLDQGAYQRFRGKGLPDEVPAVGGESIFNPRIVCVAGHLDDRDCRVAGADGAGQLYAYRARHNSSVAATRLSARCRYSRLACSTRSERISTRC